MAFVPASSLAPATVTVIGPLAVTGPLTDAQFAARLPLHVDVDNFPATQPVSGPLTDAQLRASRVPVDGSGVTQPVSVATLPLPIGAAREDTLSEVALTAILEREKLALSD